jgi:hypothetical protein
VNGEQPQRETWLGSCASPRHGYILRTDFPLRLAVVSKKSYAHVLVDVI